VAIRSAAVSATDPERLIFHFITTPEFADSARQLFKEHVPGVRIEVHTNAKLDERLRGLISWRKSSKSRRVLSSPFNFAPFYLDEYLTSEGQALNTRRLIYLDTDTLILGDLADLSDMDVQGHSCAAVPYCLQRFEDYINFDVLTELGFEKVYDPKACIANRGLLVIDVPTWKAKGLTKKIEDWMRRYATADKDLWFGGMSQPPWLLAMNGDFFALGEEWNCNSLGRDTMSMWESISLRKSGFDHKALRVLDVKYGAYGGISPYIVTCSSSAKLLHYNGEMKPWVADRLRRQSPHCSLPKSIDHKWSWNRTVRIFCDDVTFVSCSELWSLFISQRSVGHLKDIDSEWMEEERKWLEQKKEDRETAVKKRKENEKKVKDEQDRKDKEEQEKKDKEKEEKDKKKKKKEKDKDKPKQIQEAQAPEKKTEAPATEAATAAPTEPPTTEGPAKQDASAENEAKKKKAKKNKKEKKEKDRLKKEEQEREQERLRHEQEEQDKPQSDDAADEQGAEADETVEGEGPPGDSEGVQGSSDEEDSG